MNSAKKAGLVIAAAGMALGTSAGAASAYGGDGHGFHGAGAKGAAVKSPGVLSGNVIQLPVNIPLNVCGNTLDVPGLLNPAFGNTCANF